MQATGKQRKRKESTSQGGWCLRAEGRGQELGAAAALRRYGAGRAEPWNRLTVVREGGAAGAKVAARADDWVQPEIALVRGSLRRAAPEV
jgi:hypothetical protein